MSKTLTQIKIAFNAHRYLPNFPIVGHSSPSSTVNCKPLQAIPKPGRCVYPPALPCLQLVPTKTICALLECLVQPQTCCYQHPLYVQMVNSVVAIQIQLDAREELAGLAIFASNVFFLKETSKILFWTKLPLTDWESI